MLPIGAYKPDSFRYVHMNPEEDLKASLLLKSKVNIPIHHGIFSLPFENYKGSILDLKNAMNMYDIKTTHFSIL